AGVPRTRSSPCCRLRRATLTTGETVFPPRAPFFLSVGLLRALGLPPGKARLRPRREALGQPYELTMNAGEQGNNHDRHYVRDLDHRVDRRAGGVLVGVADGVTRDRRRVRLRALAAVGAVLDQLLRVV